MTNATLNQPPAAPTAAATPRAAGGQPACWETHGADPLKILDARAGALTVSFRGPLAASQDDVEVLTLQPLADLLRERLLQSVAGRDWRT